MNHDYQPPKFNSTPVADQLLRQATVSKPPEHKDVVKNLGATRDLLDARLQSYREQLKDICYDQTHKGGQQQAAIRTVNESVVDDVIAQHPDKNKDQLMKMRRGELAGFLNRFDWREKAIVPPVRNQHPGRSCWAHTATEVFESSLMIQRSNFATNDPQDSRVFVEQIALNVHSTVDCVFPHSSDLEGRHEDPFNYYLMTGIPPGQITVNGIALDNKDKMAAPIEERDPKLTEGHCQTDATDSVKAIGWDYVHSELQGDPPIPHPWEIPELDEMKTALLEHGPLAIAISSDKAFQSYGSFNFRDNGALVGKDSATGTRFEKDEKTGDLYVRFPAKLLPRDHFGLIDLSAIKPTGEKTLRLQFLADTAPLFKLGSHEREDAADRPIEVVYSSKYVLLKFPASNAVKVKDRADGGKKLAFPANTSAQFATDPATGALTAQFPWQPFVTPVHQADAEADFNHFVLLVGWDDDRCAWIIQNTYGTEWGFDCDFKGGWHIGSGYAYVGYNTIGQFAAWLEAPLLEQGLKEKFKATYSQTASQPAQSSDLSTGGGGQTKKELQ